MTLLQELLEDMKRSPFMYAAAIALIEREYLSRDIQTGNIAG